MNNKLLFLLLILTLALVKIAFFSHANIKNVNDNNGQDKLYNIAVVTPTTHPSLEQIEDGFKSSLPANYHCTTFNGNAKNSLIISQMKEIINSDYDLIFTIGGYTTQIACSLLNQKGKNIPVVSGAAADLPNKSNVTGVLDVYYPDKQVQALTYFKPRVKNVLVVYSPSQKPEIEKDTATLIAALKQKNLAVQELQLFSINEIPMKVGAFKKQVDTIVVIRDSLVVSGIDAIIKICNQNKITLVASDLDSGDKGAVLSTGIFEREYGVESAKLARKILEQNIMASSLSPIKPGSHHIKINLSSIKLQDLSVDPYVVTLLHEGVVVGGSHV